MNTYCSNFENCPMAFTCSRASWPDDITTVNLFDFYDEEEEKCQDGFVCSCSRAVYVGSNQYGNYYHCPVCGEEGEG